MKAEEKGEEEWRVGMEGAAAEARKHINQLSRTKAAGATEHADSVLISL